MLIYAILATIFVSLISLVGVLTTFKNADKNPLLLRRLIGIAVGTLLAVVFFDLLPEAITESQNTLKTTLLIVFGSILAFFIIEKIIHYHHCNCDDETKARRKTHLIVNNLVGDGINNFIDGALIGGAFLVDARLGIVTMAAVALHEIPQEITDFSILIYGGLTRAKAITWNLVFALFSVLGAVLVFYLADKIEALTPVLLAIAAALAVSSVFFFAMFAVIDRSLGPIEALKESARITEGIRLKIFLFMLAAGAINILGILLLFVGLLVTMPLTSLAMAHAYRLREHSASEMAVSASPEA